MIGNGIADRARKAFAEGRRLVAPLMGFPGIELTGSNIKVAQQNYGEHFKILKRLADRFSPDIIFPLMDLSIEANAMGRYTIFPRRDSATVPRDCFLLEEIDRFRDINISFDSRVLGYVETQKLMHIGLPPHILKAAYVTGPYTVAALIMGSQEAAVATIGNRRDLGLLCEVATGKILQYVRLLIAAGADGIFVLEPSAGMLGPAQFEEFSAAYVKAITAACRHNGVDTILHICGNTMHLVRSMAGSGVGGLSLDSPEAGVDIEAVAGSLPEDVVIIGNVSPTTTMLRGRPEDVRREVRSLLDSMGTHPNFVLSTGCDLPQETPLANIEAFMEVGREERRPAERKGRCEGRQVQEAYPE